MRSWESVSLNFIVKLLELKDPVIRIIYNLILIVVDRLIKWELFILNLEASSAEDLTYTFFSWIIIKHNLPTEIILDRDKLFILRF